MIGFELWIDREGSGNDALDGKAGIELDDVTVRRSGLQGAADDVPGAAGGLEGDDLAVAVALDEVTLGDGVLATAFKVPGEAPSSATFTRSSAAAASSVQMPSGLSVFDALVVTWSASLPIFTTKKRVAIAPSASLLNWPLKWLPSAMSENSTLEFAIFECGLEIADQLPHERGKDQPDDDD